MRGREAASDRFTMSVPARPELVGTVRAFASAVARHYALPDALVEDVKLAVSEACTDPIEAAAGGDITLTIVASVTGLVCEIASRSWAPVRHTPAELPRGIDATVLDRLQLVRALFGDAERADRDGGATVRFSTASRGPA